MKPLPYYKWFWQDYRANRTVQRMSYIERGLYRELLDECWCEGWIPDDIEAMADICGCPVSVMADAWHVLRKCFVMLDGRWHNEKLHSMRTVVDKERVSKSEAGRSGGLRKALNQKESVADASERQTGASTCHIEEKRREEKRDSEQRRSRGSRLPADWTLTDEYRKAAAEVRQDWPTGHVETVAASFRDYWHAQPGAKGVKLDWLATWRNWCRNDRGRPAGVSQSGQHTPAPRQRVMLTDRLGGQA